MARRVKLNFTRTDSFNYVWDRLALVGQCDIRGGKEYQRVKRKWYYEGRPQPIADFIRQWANMDAEGRPAPL
jgi:hypothetical protein